MTIEEKTILWKPVSEYTGGRVLATNGLDILVGELNPEGDCVSEDCSGTHLCGITHFAKIDGLFPTPRESEDEKIRKALIDYFDDANKADENPLQSYGIHTDKAIAWLEKRSEPTDINPSEFDLRLNKLLKQFEALPKEELVGSLSFWLNVVQNDGTYKADEKQDKQNPCETCSSPRLNCQNFPCERKKNFKPANKVEPKFKVGDWITNGDYTWKIVEVKPLDYILQSQDGNIVDDTISYVDEQFHSFTIEDAKDGDVLAFDNDNIVIFKDLYNATTFHSYCHIEDGIFDISKDGMPDWWEGGGFHPATKEQRDLLFSKMKESDYKWDAEKKEAKKIEQKSADEEMKEALRTEYEKGRADVIAEIQKSAWSEEDENILDAITYTVKNSGYKHCIGVSNEMMITFIKSLKGRVQPKQEWSEKDEEKFRDVIRLIEQGAPVQSIRDHYINWLKSIKTRIR